MLRTFVCEKEGCSGNSFLLESSEENLSLVCNHCHSRYENYDKHEDYIILPNCSSCNSEIFKVYKETEKHNIFYKCVKCGSVPEKIFLDSDGIQVSYEVKLLNEIKEVMKLVEQRMYNLENNIKDLENGQGSLEQSLAYINRYLIDKD